MFQDSRWRALLAVMTIIVAAYIIWHDDPGTDIAANNVAPENREIDAYIKDGQYIVFSKTGKIKIVVTSPETRHYPSDDNSILQSPDVIFYQVDRPPWNVTADHGVYNSNADLLDLEGNVKVVQQDNTPSPWTLMTSSLQVNTRTRFISTDQQVNISNGRSMLTGKGMQANADDRQITLLSTVRGTYVPMHQ